MTTHDATERRRGPNSPSSAAPSLTLSRQAPAARDVTAELDETTTPAEFARYLARRPALQDAAVDNTREALAGRSWREVHELVDEHDLEFTNPDDDLAGLLIRLGLGSERAIWQLLIALARAGAGRRPLDDWRILPRLLALSDAVRPTVTVRVSSGFRDVRREHRERIVGLVVALARGTDVRVVGTGLTLRWLERAHLDDVDGVTGDLSTRPSEARVSEAREALAPDGPYTATLRALREQPSETATYDALAEALDIRRGALRARLSRLRDLGLVADGYGTADGTATDLRPAGSAYLDAVAEAVGEQIGLDECETGVSHRSDDAVYSPHAHGDPHGGEAAAADRDRHRLPSRHDVTYLSRREAVPPAEIAPENGVAVVNHPVEPRDDRASVGWSYDDEADTLVVSAEWGNPLQYGVCLARALTDGRIWRHVLDEDRLGDVDLEARLAEQKSLLRGCRCLGYLPDYVDDVAGYADELREARDDLLGLTRDLRHDEYDLPTDEFRALITREALGLAGTAAHLLDLAGVEIVREVRLPTYTRDFNRGSADGRKDRDDLTRNLGVIAAIQSAYRNHTGYRQLLEDRAEKREQTPSVQVDADDPLGALIGSIVVVGDLGDRAESLADALRADLGAPADVHDDAPEFQVHVPVETDGVGRSWTAATARAMLERKNLKLTRAASALLDGYCQTPYDVAEALAALGSEPSRRRIRQSEVRFALAHLDADRLLSREAAPSAREIVATLLDADGPLTRQALTERGDVSRASTYRHLSRLKALSLVEETPEGYRLALAFHTDEERHADRLPAWMDDEHTAPRDVLYDAAVALVDDVSRAGDPADPVFRAWLDPPPDGIPRLDDVAEAWPWVERWGLPLVAGLLQEAPPGWDEDHRRRAARLGPELEQAPLDTAGEPTAEPHLTPS